ncbi:PP2C family protein-serine/threonine phosphatase [Noviherbaspirillum sp. CPCC 100848]|uniref:PP2C family protein-serine/threonine phosphatase n=1 Tax=Noviherbaspirillum album TaxID=3080276 RepID=A0ABU6JAN2_9BURK|nr:PP2C family protein-serine/threonine phosphatase [Noviherbaspirillum sp. CPCC 100848]MEC4720710.1 PP2C family protein-serine/threonine phosphatase [Noviherbaspirillum sp. CPCC 100848]
MKLKNRIVMVVLGLVLLLQGVLGALVWNWHQAAEARMQKSLLARQGLAWQKMEAEAIARLRDAADSLGQAREVAQIFRQDRFEKAIFSESVAQALAAAGNPRIDIQNRGLGMLYTSDSSLKPERVLELGWTDRVLKTQRRVSGVAQLGNHHYVWVYSREAGQSEGFVTLSLDVDKTLNGFADNINGQAFIVSSRGREILGTEPGLLKRLGIDSLPAGEAVRRVRLDRHYYDVVSQPLLDPSRRRIGSIVGIIDATDDARSEQRLHFVLLSIAATFLLLVGAAIWVFIQQAFVPVNAAIDVLERLANGDIDAQPDDDVVADEEVTRISTGLLRLRRDVVTLRMLKDEQARASQQQEFLIRDQLRSLADSLDPQSRTDVLKELEASTASDAPPEETSRDEGDNQLAKLAGILGRMAGLVTNQQARLLTLLKELQEAMETQAQFLSLQQELEIARSIQQSILPRIPLDVQGVEIAATMIPAKEVGGDFYDYFMIDEHRLGVVVADVSGKGVPAAFFMAISRTLLKSSVMFFREPKGAMRRLNDQLCAENDQMMFVTVFLGVFDIRTGDFRYVNAGHNPPALIRRNGETCYLPRADNMGLAVLEDQDFEEGHLVLEEGDSLFLFTDGVTEAMNPEHELFGESALLDNLRESNALPAARLDSVIAQVRAFSRDEPQSDDITCVALRYSASSSRIS